MLLKYKMEAGPDADRSPDFEKHCFKGAQLFAKWSFVLVYPTSLILHKSKYFIIFAM